MNRKITLVLMIILLSTIVLFAEKSLERLGNEAEYAGDELFGAKDYAGAIVKYEEAVAKFNEAAAKDEIPVDDKLAGIDDKVFKSYYFGGQYEKSIVIKKKILAANPKDMKTLKVIAQIYEKKIGDRNQAITFLKGYDAEHPNNNTVIKRISSNYRKLEDFPNAIIWYEKSYALKQDAKIINNIAIMYNNIDKPDMAVKAYEDFIKTNPSEAKLRKTYQNMGALYEEMGNHKDAAANYEKANNMKFDKNITTKLISMYHDKQEMAKASENIAKLLANDPGNEDALYYRGLIAHEGGNKAAAKADFQKLTSSKTYGKIATGFIASIDSE